MRRKLEALYTFYILVDKPQHPGRGFSGIPSDGNPRCFYMSRKYFFGQRLNLANWRFETPLFNMWNTRSNILRTAKKTPHRPRQATSSGDVQQTSEFRHFKTLLCKCLTSEGELPRGAQVLLIEYDDTINGYYVEQYQT